MRPLEIIDEMSGIISTLSDIVRKQQTEIERSKVEESVRAELRSEIDEVERRMDANEYHLRHVIDVDDGTNAEEE